MSLVMRKPAFRICENKDADQLRSYSAADQRLCFRYMDSTILFYLNEAVLTSTHNLFLEQKLGNNVYPCASKFYFITVG